VRCSVAPGPFPLPGRLFLFHYPACLISIHFNPLLSQPASLRSVSPLTGGPPIGTMEFSSVCFLWLNHQHPLPPIWCCLLDLFCAVLSLDQPLVHSLTLPVHRKYFPQRACFFLPFVARLLLRSAFARFFDPQFFLSFLQVIIHPVLFFFFLPWPLVAFFPLLAVAF